MRHVDVIAIDIHRSTQQRVGVIAQVSDDSIVEKDVTPSHEALIAEVLDGCAGMSAEDALWAAAAALSGSYATATEPHDSSECPFRAKDEIPLETGNFGNVPLPLAL